ncbi:MAG: AbrB/MazE/SpoVT family DNA-binding domain-containing protein [bacterium]
MKVTSKGQITIPLAIREMLGIVPNSEVSFIKQNGKVYLEKIKSKNINQKYYKYRGVATVTMTTDEIMELTRNP